MRVRMGLSPGHGPRANPVTRRAFLGRAVIGSLGIGLAGALAAYGRRVPAPLDTSGRTDFAPPFAIATAGGLRPLWTLAHRAVVTDPSMLRLPRGATVESPWVDSTPGARYQLVVTSNGPVRVSTKWFDAARRPMAMGDAARTLQRRASLIVTTPANAGGFRLQLGTDTDDVAVTALSLALVGGVRVEPFPDFQRAAFAFSYDWESAMGGLIHTRSPANSEGDGTQVALHSDGSPVVADAEDKGMRMRDGARFLAAQFATHAIRATFYATGYNLLAGNADHEQFLGDPVYSNADAAHGWGSDYWHTHPWYEHDPFGTEQTHPAWYFASLTRELAAAGHEIASHSFGHLYVRGVKPEQLEADLQLWQRAAATLGVRTAPSFAFPWTSSNSLDERFWMVFARIGWMVLTRLYPHDLRYPYELDRVPADPRLAVFPDFYLQSHAAMLDEALAHIEETVARRGYHSFWTHPNEVLEQDGRMVWTRVIAAANDARDRGLWIAPVTEIAGHAVAARAVVVSAEGAGRRFSVENPTNRDLSGLTLTMPYRVQEAMMDGKPLADVRGDQVRLPTLAAGSGVIIEVTPL